MITQQQHQKQKYGKLYRLQRGLDVSYYVNGSVKFSTRNLKRYGFEIYEPLELCFLEQELFALIKFRAKFRHFHDLTDFADTPQSIDKLVSLLEKRVFDLKGECDGEIDSASR